MEFTVTLLDFRRDQVGRQPYAPTMPSVPHRHHSSWQRAALEVAGTFFVLIGIALVILTLRFALVLMHGVLN